MTPDERNDSHRKHHLDYILRPGMQGKGKAADYIYVGYYYALQIQQPGMSFCKLKWMFLLAPSVQIVLVLAAGLMISSINTIPWTIFPYVLSLIACCLSWAGALLLFRQKENEFVRSVRDKGVLRLKTGQYVLAATAFISVAAEIVNLFGGGALDFSQSLLFLAVNAVSVALALLLAVIIKLNPVYILRDAGEDYLKL